MKLRREKMDKSSLNYIYEKNLPFGKFYTYSSPPEFKFYEVEQVHGIEIVLPNEGLCKADGMIVDRGNDATLAIRTADCMPVVLIGEKQMALVHIGWKGLAGGIIDNEKLLKMKPNYAFIGPCISALNYEVSGSFKKNFPGSSSFLNINDKLFFDLETQLRSMLYSSYGEIVIESANICTYDDERFFSYRRNGTDKRNWNIYRP